MESSNPSGTEATVWVLCTVMLIGGLFYAGRMSVQIDHELECSPEIASIEEMERDIEQLSTVQMSKPIPEATKCVAREKKICDKRIAKTKKLFQELRCKICNLVDNPEGE